jgi:hypothetical protein
LRSVTESDARNGGFASSARLVWWGAVAAAIGGVLVGVGVVWVVLTSGILASASVGAPAVLFRLAGPTGVALTTASVVGIYALLARVGSRPGIILARVGLVAALLSLAALAWIVLHQPPFASPLATVPGEPLPLLAVSSVTLSWVRPAAILVFGVAARRAEVLGRWKYLLFAIGVLETPLPSVTLFTLLGPRIMPGWPGLLAGLPGVQTGLVGAACWVALGYALLRSGRDLSGLSGSRGDGELESPSPEDSSLRAERPPAPPGTS